MPGGNGMGPPEGQAGRIGRKRGTQPGAGPGGQCVCPGCGKKMPHQQGEPCFEVKCPDCGTRMVRE